MAEISVPLDRKAYTVKVKREEVEQLVRDKATQELSRGHAKGVFKLAFLESDNYGGFIVTFLESQEKGV